MHPSFIAVKVVRTGSAIYSEFSNLYSIIYIVQETFISYQLQQAKNSPRLDGRASAEHDRESRERTSGLPPMVGRRSNLVLAIIVAVNIGVRLNDVLVKLDSSVMRYRMFLGVCCSELNKQTN